MIKITVLTIMIFRSLENIEEHQYFFISPIACAEMGERLTRIYNASPRQRPHTSWDCAEEIYAEVN